MTRLTGFLESRTWLTVTVLLLAFGGMAIFSVREKSNTFDELAHLTAGYSYWHTGDYRLHPENGVLPQRWAALPLLLEEVRFPDTNSEAWWNSDVWQVGHDFFFQLQNDADRILWSARGMIVLLGMALGGVVYIWSRRLFGPVGAAISLTAYVFCPNLLAHSALVTSDVAAALAFIVSLGAFWIVLHRVSVWTMLASSLAMGLLFVSKFSAVLILPIALSLVAIRVAAGRPMLIELRGRQVTFDRARQLTVIVGILAIHAGVVAVVIWAFYGFHYETFRTAEPDRDQMYGEETIDAMAPDNLLGSAIELARDYRLLPEPYLHGFAFTLARSERRNAFFNGAHSVEGWRTFFPYCLLVKTPLATLALFLAAAAAVAAYWFGDSNSRRRSQNAAERRWRRGLYRTAPLWVFLMVYWLVAITSHLNIGHRHILPTYPMMFILCGAAGYWFRGQHPKMQWLVIALLTVLVVESVTVAPHYLTYFNRLAGGPSQGYRHLVDSSLDWGQDLPGLKRWLAERQELAMRGKPVYLSYFGSSSPEYYSLNVRRLPGYMDWRPPEIVPIEPGTYCISATMLQSVYSMINGEWDEQREVYYQRVLKAFGEIIAEINKDPAAYQKMLTDPESAQKREQWSQIFAAYNEARLSRLCAFLRLREPDDEVGHSILIYYLDGRDLEAAQTGSPHAWPNYQREGERSRRGGI